MLPVRQWSASLTYVPPPFREMKKKKQKHDGDEDQEGVDTKSEEACPAAANQGKPTSGKGGASQQPLKRGQKVSAQERPLLIWDTLKPHKLKKEIESCYNLARLSPVFLQSHRIR